jgi:hypothetical protein
MEPKVPAEASGGPPSASSPTARRMRRYRERRRRGWRCFHVPFDKHMIEGLVRWKYLEEKDRDKVEEVGFAAASFLSDALEGLL